MCSVTYFSWNEHPTLFHNNMNIFRSLLFSAYMEYYFTFFSLISCNRSVFLVFFNYIILLVLVIIYIYIYIICIEVYGIFVFEIMKQSILHIVVNLFISKRSVVFYTRILILVRHAFRSPPFFFVSTWL